jgi:hypothetical protein
MDLDFRYVLRFPARLSDADVENPVCNRIRPL